MVIALNVLRHMMGFCGGCLINIDGFFWWVLMVFAVDTNWRDVVHVNDLPLRSDSRSMEIPLGRSGFGEILIRPSAIKCSIFGIFKFP